MKVQGNIDTTGGYHIPDVLHRKRKKLTQLNPDLVKSGVVYVEKKKSPCAHEECTVLYLSPGAVIAEHGHPENVRCERYSFFDPEKQTFVTETCEKGEQHSLENTSRKKWAVVLSTKVLDI